MVFFCTDNLTVENALYNGRSKTSKSLHELVVRMKVLEAKYNFQLLVIHVSGKRMKAQGTDGISRGQLTKGVMNGESMLSFLPMHEMVLERHPSLKDWIIDTMGSGLTFLKTDRWFERGHNNHMEGGKIGWDGHWRPAICPMKHVWTPPPAARQVALEELCKSQNQASALHSHFRLSMGDDA
jgi:hypothetical protein